SACCGGWGAPRELDRVPRRGQALRRRRRQRARRRRPVARRGRRHVRRRGGPVGMRQEHAAPPGGGARGRARGAGGGLEARTAGAVLVGDQPVREPAPDRAVVFQRLALFPWKTARENIAFGLRNLKVSPAERKATVDHSL